MAAGHSNAYRGRLQLNWVVWIPATQACQLVQNLVAIQVYVEGWPCILLIQQGLNLEAPIRHPRRQFSLNLCCCGSLHRNVNSHRMNERKEKFTSAAAAACTTMSTAIA